MELGWQNRDITLRTNFGDGNQPIQPHRSTSQLRLNRCLTNTALNEGIPLSQFDGNDTHAASCGGIDSPEEDGRTT